MFIYIMLNILVPYRHKYIPLHIHLVFHHIYNIHLVLVLLPLMLMKIEILI